MEYFRQRFVDELNDEGNVEVGGCSWSRHQVLETMDPDACQDLFEAWVDGAKQTAKQRAADFLRENGCLDRFKGLTKRIANQNVIPFVGAGMSIPSGFSPWGTFLISLMADAPADRNNVELLLSTGEFEKAAEAVEASLGADVFAEEIETKLGDHHVKLDGAIRLLLSIFRNEAITTNFDYVLPNAYRAEDLPFAETYCGEHLTDACKRLGDEPHCLLRLHGDAHTRKGRVLTAKEYKAAYSDGALVDLVERIVGTRSLLFLGCSLVRDRTLAALRTIKANTNGEPVRHYAFLPLPPSSQRKLRRAYLAEAEIHPIYYPPDEHDQCIEDLLITILEGGPDE